MWRASRGSKGRTRLAFTRRIPGLKSETWGTLRVSRAEWVWGFRVFPQALQPYRSDLG